MPRWIASIASAVALLGLCLSPAWAMEKVALLSSTMVLERKFQLMQEAARSQGVELAWTQVDAEGEKGVKRVLEGARLVLIDAPRTDDQALVERIAGAQLRVIPQFVHVIEARAGNRCIVKTFDDLLCGQRSKAAADDVVEGLARAAAFAAGVKTRIGRQRRLQ